MIIEVDDSCFDGSERNSTLYCPVAKAMSKAGLVMCGATYSRLSWAEGSGIVSRSTPRKVERFMRAFDRGEPVGTFNFSLRIKKRSASTWEDAQ